MGSDGGFRQIAFPHETAPYTMATTSEIRTTFLNFFAKNGHEIVESSPLVPRNDPTLLFTNAGMVQFKNVFTGLEQRPYSRAVTSQKCVRAGGKHNDLENVGYTARHHTFFEMLGNFSFGDYFKDVAIENAWNLITKEYGLPKDKLLVTVYSEDEEAAALWRKIAGLPDDKIIRISTSDNFWAMGDTGPCGPCSEIFFDHGPGIPGGPPGSPNEDGDRFIEIWNLVFMQYEQLSKDERLDLPRPSIDTGMGLERITAVMQGKHNNYDIDLMRALVLASAEATSVEPDGAQAASHRVIADHLRAASFLIADGVLPSNEGRGYVLRRIMRRGMRHAHLLGSQDPLMWRLVPELIHQMGAAFPELGQAQPLIAETLKLEEERFKQTLGRGLRLLDQETENLSAGGTLDGEIAFRLYDTFGFPLDLTQDVLRARDIAVDTDRFNAVMDRQRADARAAWSGSGEAVDEAIWFDLRDQFGATEFLGYTSTEAEGQVLAIIQNGQQVTSIADEAEAVIILNQTPFYGESGGQTGDAGQIAGENGQFTVTDTQKRLGDLLVHQGRLSAGGLSVGDAVTLRVDTSRRDATQRNHSATHLLHAALRRTLGGHVAQKGSLVSADRLRFDISHPKAIAAVELAQIEQEVNKRVRLNAPVSTRLMPTDQAIEAGAMALFGEKYGDEVRVVTMGGIDPDVSDQAYSLELCGGTHVEQTGDIGNFLVVSESAVAAGVRRIEALTGAAAQAYTASRLQVLDDVAQQLRTTPELLGERIASLLDERRKLERDVTELRRQLATGGSGANEAVQEIAGIKYAGRKLDDVPAKDLRGMADDIKGQLGSGIVAIITTNDGKGSLVVGVTDDLKEKISAVDLVRIGAAAMGGKGGGGRPDMAQAGGPDGSQADAALKAIAAAIG
jgi:alanyl-tRNA synthetase